MNELIEWLHKEANRNSQMQGEKKTDGSKAHSCNRRRTFRHRAHQLRQTADVLERLQERISWIDMSPGLKCPNCNDTGGYAIDDGHDGCQEEQCEFCWVVDDSIFNKSRRATETVGESGNG